MKFRQINNFRRLVPGDMLIVIDESDFGHTLFLWCRLDVNDLKSKRKNKSEVLVAAIIAVCPKNTSNRQHLQDISGHLDIPLQWLSYISTTVEKIIQLKNDVRPRERNSSF